MSFANPDPDEWLALSAFFVTGLIGWFSVIVSGAGFRLRGYSGWHRKSEFSFMVHPFAFAVFLFIAQCAASVSAWLAWREGHRSDNVPPDPSSGVVPTNTIFFLENIFYFIYWTVLLISGPLFFMVMLIHHVVWPAALLAFIMLCLSIALLVLGFLIWTVIGGIYVIPVVFWAYAVIVLFCFCKQYDCKVCHMGCETVECLTYKMEVETEKKMSASGGFNIQNNYGYQNPNVQYRRPMQGGPYQ